MIERIKNWTLLLASVVGLLGCLVAAEVLIARHNLRWDFTEENLFSLSSHTKKILDSLKEPVDVMIFTRDDDPRNDYFGDLVRQAASQQPLLRYKMIDVNRNPSVAKRYGAQSYGSVIVLSGGRQRQFSNMSEDLLASAIIEVTRGKKKKVYVLSGHGESNFEDSHHKRGYTTAKSSLKNEFYEVEILTLQRGAGVPEDASVLIISGPRQDFSSDDLEALEAYIRRGSGLMVMVDPGSSPSLGEFLERYNVGLPDEVVADQAESLAAGEPLSSRIPDLATNHMATAALEAKPLFSLSRPVIALDKRDRDAAVLTLLKTSKDSWAIPIVGDRIPDNVAYDPERHRYGQQTVGVEVVVPIRRVNRDEIPSGEAVPRENSRIMVYGDADFANNFFIQYLGNRDLFVNSVDWLAREADLIGFRPEKKQTGTEQVFIGRSQAYWALMYSTVFLPSVFLGFGVLVFLWRRIR